MTEITKITTNPAGCRRLSRCQAEISPGTAQDKEVARDKGISRRVAAGLNITRGSGPARGKAQPREKPSSGWRKARGDGDGFTGVAQIREDEEIKAGGLPGQVPRQHRGCRRSSREEKSPGELQGRE